MTDKSGTPGTATTSQSSDPVAKMPKPLIAAAGAGDLAVEKFRDLSQRAADRLSSLETDPSAFADRVQVGIETQADALGNAFRSARTSVQGQAQDLSEKAQSVLQTAVTQAGDTYETLARRGEGVVGRLRRPERATGAASPARQLRAEPESVTKAKSKAASKVASQADSSASAATVTKSASASAGKSASTSSSKPASKSTTRSAGKSASKSTGPSTTKATPHRKTSRTTATKRSES